MVENQVRGSYKDYVIIAGYRLIEWTETVDIRNDQGTVGVEGTVLIHKRRLAAVIGPEAAARYWKPGIGRVQTGAQNIRRTNAVRR